jgi:hypothetical protein
MPFENPREQAAGTDEIVPIEGETGELVSRVVPLGAEEETADHFSQRLFFTIGTGSGNDRLRLAVGGNAIRAESLRRELAERPLNLFGKRRIASTVAGHQRIARFVEHLLPQHSRQIEPAVFDALIGSLEQPLLFGIGLEGRAAWKSFFGQILGLLGRFVGSRGSAAGHALRALELFDRSRLSKRAAGNGSGEHDDEDRHGRA